ncbi:MAG: carboxypeptidase-like regulatory domain-containing protein, partial [Planctomycetota bacterium]|nr:carboxypeptidase-like regulatory domain-containing protein [Planctomycetota bacterium]
LMIPWNSGDENDFGLTGDGEIGLKILWMETRKTGNYWHWARHQGKAGFPDSLAHRGNSYARLKVRGLTRKRGKPFEKINLVLKLPAPKRFIQGRITGPNGQPVPGALVQLSVSNSPSQGQSVRSDANGDFRLPFEKPEAKIPNQEHWVLVTSRNFASASKQIASDVTRCDFVLSKGSPLAGKVIDSAGKPLPGADVVIYFGKRYLVAAEGRTNGQGEFRFEHIPDGRLGTLIRHKQRSLRHWSEASPQEGRLDIDLSPPLHVRGSVVAEETGEPIQVFKIHVGRMWYDRKNPQRTSSVYWDSRKTKEYRSEDGTFEHHFGEPGNFKFFLLIDSPGKQPLWIDREF